MKELKLTQGKVALVDDEDYEKLSIYSWCAVYSIKGKNWYAKRGMNVNKKVISILLHREIMKTPKGLIVDHKNHNGLDNQKSNLRNCTYTENLMNRKSAVINSKSKYLGVNWNKHGQKWHAQIMNKKRQFHIGFFDTEKSAAIARDKAAIQIHGDFASLNFPELFHWGGIQ